MVLQTNIDIFLFDNMGLEDLDVGGWVATIQTTILLTTTRILRRVLETWGHLLSLKLQLKTIN